MTSNSATLSWHDDTRDSSSNDVYVRVSTTHASSRLCTRAAGQPGSTQQKIIMWLLYGILFLASVYFCSNLITSANKSRRSPYAGVYTRPGSNKYTIIRCFRGDIYCAVCVPFCLVASQMVVWIMGEKRNLEAEWWLIHLLCDKYIWALKGSFKREILCLASTAWFWLSFFRQMVLPESLLHLSEYQAEAVAASFSSKWWWWQSRRWEGR